MRLQKQHDALIVLDFDHTLFNTTQFVDKLKQAFQKEFAITPETFDKARRDFKQMYTVEDVDQFVGHLPHPDKQAMHDVFIRTAAQAAEAATHTDAKPFIERHQDSFDIVLLTHGDQELQETKIKHSGLPDLPYVIVQESKAGAFKTFVRRYETIFFIDDRAENIDDVKTAYPQVEAYFMKRRGDRPYGDIEPVCKCADKVVENLDFTLTPSDGVTLRGSKGGFTLPSA